MSKERKWDPVEGANNVVNNFAERLEAKKKGKNFTPDPVIINEDSFEEEKVIDDSKYIISANNEQIMLAKDISKDPVTGQLKFNNTPTAIVYDDNKFIYVTDNRDFGYKVKKTAKDLFNAYYEVSEAIRSNMRTNLNGFANHIISIDNGIVLESFKLEVANMNINDDLIDINHPASYSVAVNDSLLRLWGGMTICVAYHIFHDLVETDMSDKEYDKKIELFSDSILSDAFLFATIDHEDIVEATVSTVYDITESIVIGNIEDISGSISLEDFENLLKDKVGAISMPEDVAKELREKGVPEDIIKNMIAIPIDALKDIGGVILPSFDEEGNSEEQS